ncbi:hypothetical protein AWM69_21745 [Pseudomonas sp. D1HM]|nr:hypothetical protein [Pseudomonas sp. D1HM]
MGQVDFRASMAAVDTSWRGDHPSGDESPVKTPLKAPENLGQGFFEVLGQCAGIAIGASKAFDLTCTGLPDMEKPLADGNHLKQAWMRIPNFGCESVEWPAGSGRLQAFTAQWLRCKSVKSIHGCCPHGL